jgi:hypothetical protein
VLNDCLGHSVDRLMSCLLGSVSKRSRLEVGLKDRLQDELERPLHHPIPDSRHGYFELHIGPASLWDRPRSPIPFIPFEVISLWC